MAGRQAGKEIINYYMRKNFNRVCITYLKPKYIKNSTTLILHNKRTIPG